MGIADFSTSGARFICKVTMEDDEAKRLGTAIVGLVSGIAKGIEEVEKNSKTRLTVRNHLL